MLRAWGDSDNVKPTHSLGCIASLQGYHLFSCKCNHPNTGGFWKVTGGWGVSGCPVSLVDSVSTMKLNVPGIGGTGGSVTNPGSDTG